MEEEFDFGSPEEQKASVNRYEEMIRNEDQYFFDSIAFEGIIDFYTEKNDPIKALQVISFAMNQHPFETSFLLKKAQILATLLESEAALDALSQAEILQPSDGDINLIRGSIYANMGLFSEAEECFYKALENSDNKEEIYYQLALLYQH